MINFAEYAGKYELLEKIDPNEDCEEIILTAQDKGLILNKSPFTQVNTGIALKTEQGFTEYVRYNAETRTLSKNTSGSFSFLGTSVTMNVVTDIQFLPDDGGTKKIRIESKALSGSVNAAGNCKYAKLNN